MRIRADRWLRDRYPGLSRRQSEEALESGLVRLTGGGRARKGDRVDRLETASLEAHLVRLRRGKDLEVAVLEEGKGWIAVDKPAGLHGHPISLLDDSTLTHWAFARHPGCALAFPQIQPTLVPHRLDQGTSGLQVVALDPEAFASWRGKFSRGEMTKHYLAWVCGIPPWDRLEVEWPLAHDPKDRRRMVAVKGRVRHRPPLLQARTEFRLEARGAEVALLSAVCRTGVTHQVRVHAASAGFPLVGDTLYGGDAGDKAWHQLRAVALEGEGIRLRAPEGPFREAYLGEN